MDATNRGGKLGESKTSFYTEVSANGCSGWQASTVEDVVLGLPYGMNHDKHNNSHDS